MSRENKQTNGFRFFILTAGLACAAGLSVRLHFSPERVTGLIRDAVARHGNHLELKFSSAQLELAHGSWPTLAISLADVEAGAANSCGAKPAVRVSRLRIPLQFGALIEGRLAAGEVYADNVLADLDRLQKPCPLDAERAAASVPAQAHSVSSSDGSNPSEKSAGKSVWWKREHLQKTRDVLAGLALENVELRYENGTKRVFLESLTIDTKHDENHIELTTGIRLPLETTYGERVPPLKVAALVRADRAEINASAVLSEGSLIAVASLQPMPAGDMTINLRATVNDVPLSTMMPLLVKTRITKNSVRPRYLWLDCSASVEGRMHGLFKENPVHLSGCELAGNWARIRLDSAVRKPNGRWDPFAVKLAGVDINRLLQTFDRKGPEGIATEFGRLSGVVTVRSPEDASFAGSLVGTSLRFSSRDVRVLQRLNETHLTAELQGSRVNALVERIEIEEGEFKGRIAASVDRRSGRGELKGDVSKLLLAPKIQQLLVRGTWGNLSGEVNMAFAEGKATSLKGEMKATDVIGSEYRFQRADVEVGLASSGGVDVSLRAPAFEISQTSPTFLAGQSLFAGQVFKEDWVKIDDLSLQVHLPGNGKLRWDKAQGSLVDGKFRFHSIGEIGSVTGSRNISGSVTLEHPSAKKKHWSLGGTAERPAVREASAKKP